MRETELINEVSIFIIKNLRKNNSCFTNFVIEYIGYIDFTVHQCHGNKNILPLNVQIFDLTEAIHNL